VTQIVSKKTPTQRKEWKRSKWDRGTTKSSAKKKDVQGKKKGRKKPDPRKTGSSLPMTLGAKNNPKSEKG